MAQMVCCALEDTKEHPPALQNPMDSALFEPQTAQTGLTFHHFTAKSPNDGIKPDPAPNRCRIRFFFFFFHSVILFIIIIRKRKLP